MYPEVKTFGSTNQVKITTNYLIDDLEADEIVEEKLRDKNEMAKKLESTIFDLVKTGIKTKDIGGDKTTTEFTKQITQRRVWQLTRRRSRLPHTRQPPMHRQHPRQSRSACATTKTNALFSFIFNFISH